MVSRQRPGGEKGRRGREARARREETGLTLKQEAYCREYVVDERQTEAAVRAGYAAGSAKVKASEMMRNPTVLARINELRRERDERAILSGADLLRYMDTAILACFTDHFAPGSGGRWVCRREDFSKVPVEIKRLIEEMETKTYVNQRTGEREETLHVRFVSKSAMVALRAKYTLTERHQSTVVTIDFDRIAGVPAPDPVEEAIRRAGEAGPVPLAVTSRDVTALVKKNHIDPRPGG